MPDSVMLEHIQLGEVVPVVLSTPYHQDPLATLASLRDGGEHLLLESAEIDSRENLKSILLVDPSVRLVCNQQTVRVTALTDNGRCIVSFLAEHLAPLVAEGSVALAWITSAELELEFRLPAAHLNERERLQAVSNVAPLRILQQQLKSLREHPFAIFLGGVFAYDFYATFESLPAPSETPENTCPDYQYYLAETLLVIDHQQRSAELVGSLAGGELSENGVVSKPQQRYQGLCQRMGEILSRVQIVSAPETKGHSTTPTQVTATPNNSQFVQHVRELKEAIVNGDIFQVVPSRRFRLACQNGLASYAELKKNNPSPYMFYLQTQNFELFGASPESALKFTAASRQVELYPIAGTRKRARNAQGELLADQDSRIELELRMDSKEMAEHMMLVDLARNDLARIAETGSRYVADLLKVDRYSHVMHLVSRVVAILILEFDALHAYRACMNMGTLVGAPKISAAQRIR